MTCAPTGSTLSPRQQLQSSIRKLSTEDVHHHRRNKSISLKYNPYELQHVSSLRVAPLRRPASKAGPTSLRHVVEEPDFGTEERDVWSRRSPAGKTEHKNTSDFVLYEDASASPSQQGDRIRDLPTLGPTHLYTTSATDERPKTSRGSVYPSAFELMTSRESESDAEEVDHLGRTPKFVEGTMTSRSGPVASTWSDSGYTTSSSEAEDTDLDVTPKASRKRRSVSIDLREFQPPSSASSAIKRTLFGRKQRDNKPEKQAKGKELVACEATKPKKHRLRKSISKLQFLGEKMKAFGSSSQDLPGQVDEESVQKFQDEKSILDERKRKAEAAYAQQFGFKKQRDNHGLANITSSPDHSVESRGLGGNQKYDSSTVRHRAASTRSRRISTGSMLIEPSLSRQSSINEHDIRKRPSRRELEKENQQLRVLLRQSQTFHEQPTVYSSETESIPPIPPLRIRRSRASASHEPVTQSNHFSIRQDLDECAPPVPPQHPDRRVLGNVSNSQSRRSRRESFGVISELDSKEIPNPNRGSSVLQNVPKLAPTPSEKKTPMTPRRSMPAMPRSVGIIVEESENEVEEKKRSLRSRTVVYGKENTALAGTMDAKGRQEEWQWPDDVF